MAEPYLTDIVGQYQRGQAIGTAQRQEREERARQSRLSELASLAYGAQGPERQAAIGQAYGVDPQFAAQLSGQLGREDESRQTALLQSARLLQSAPPESRPALYQRIRPSLSQYLPDLPPEYSDQVEQGTRAFIAAYGGPGGGDVKVVGNSLVDPTGRVIYEAPQRFQTDAGLIEVGPQGAREITLGAANPPGVYIDPSLPPEVQADIRARPDFYAQAPEAATVPDQTAIGAVGGRILPRGTSAEQRRLELSERSAARQEEAARRSEESAARSERNTERAAKQTLVQGERDLRREVSDRVKDSRTILSAYDKIKTAASNPSAANDRALIFSYMKMLDPGSVVREGEFANAQNAAGVPDRVVNVYNNALRGEILNPDQRQQFAASASQIADSAQRQIDDVAIEYRQIAEDYGFDPKRATGLDAPKPREPARGSGVGRAPPPVGTVQGGYRFKGGNPANQANWEAL